MTQSPYATKIQSSQATLLKWTGSYVEFLRQLDYAWHEGVKAGRQAERQERERELGLARVGLSESGQIEHDLEIERGE